MSSAIAFTVPLFTFLQKRRIFGTIVKRVINEFIYTYICLKGGKNGKKDNILKCRRRYL